MLALRLSPQLPWAARWPSLGRIGHLRGLNIALEQNAYGHLNNGLGTGLFVAVHLVHADIVLAIAGSGESAHCDKRWGDKDQELATRGFRKRRRLDSWDLGSRRKRQQLNIYLAEGKMG